MTGGRSFGINPFRVTILQFDLMTPTLKFSAVQMLGLAALGVAAGAWLKQRLPLIIMRSRTA